MDIKEDTTSYAGHELKLINRKEISLTGIKKITSFDSEEFLLESNMGFILIKGSNLEILRLDTENGHVRIKGKVNSFTYLENGKEKVKEENIFTKLFK